MTSTHQFEANLKKTQLAKLRKYLSKYILPFSPYYKKKLENVNVQSLTSWESLEQIPFTRKSDLLSSKKHPAKPREFILQPDEKVLKKRLSTIFRALTIGKKKLKLEFEREFRPAIMTSTTGRSSEPVPFLYTLHDIENLKKAGRRMMKICQSQHDFKHINLFPFAPHLAFWQMHYAGIALPALCISTGGGKTMGTKGNLDLIKKISPDAIIGMPTFIYHVLSRAVEESLKLPNIQRIVLGGEKAPTGLRTKLHQMLTELGASNVNIISTYGFTEAKMAFPECPCPPGENSGFHLYPDLSLVEIVDPKTGKQLPAGSAGEIIFTPLDARGSVVLRYRTGDLISEGITYEPCPYCQAKVPRLIGRISRVSSVKRLNIDKLKGNLVNFDNLEHCLDSLDFIGQWQIEIRKRNNDPLNSDEIIIHAVPMKSASQKSSLSKAKMSELISQEMQKATELTPNKINFINSSQMRKQHGVGKLLKEEKILDNRPPQSQ